MKRRLFALVPLIAVIVTVLSSFITVSPLSSTAYAAIPSDAKLLAQGKANAKCKTAGFGGTSDVETCAKYYLAGYKDGYNNGGKTALDKACDGDKVGIFIGHCKIGYKAGQEAGKRQKQAEASPPPPANSSLTDAQIKALGKTNTTCAQYAGSAGALMESCVAGYLGGYKGQDKNTVCDGSKVTLPATCKRGFDAGVKDKAAKVTNQAQQTAASAVPSDSDSDTANQQLDCDMSESPLSWILCPIIDTLASFIDGLDRIITGYLEVDTSKIFDSSSDTSAAYHAAWQSFRNIALGLMIIAGLVIVISQALGMEILDAYTIRKTLPRLLIAAIGISLSWPLMHFLIDASNWLGFGIRRLIYFPFTQNGLDATIDLTFGGGIGSSLIGGGALAVTGVTAGAAWLVLGGIGTILSLAASGALAVLIAVLVLVLRQIAIILLLLIAPIAIIAFALPNTHKFYKFWWESFSKALLMFPLIAAFIATGRVFAAISFSDKDNPISQLIGFVAYIAPYFLIPLTFRFAGGFVSQLGGFVNDRGRGGFDALRNIRKNQRKSRMERVRGAGLYRKKTGVPGALNKLGFYTWNADEQVPYDLGTGTGLGRGKYNPLGAAGKTMFGRMGADMAGQKGLATADHTAKAVEKSKLHYSAAWAALGMRDKMIKNGGMTEEGISYMDDKYGIKDDEGNYTGWKAPKNADFRGLQTYGQELARFGEEGSDAQMAGRELTTKAGILSSFGADMETQRATLQSVAAATAGVEGKLSTEDVANMYNTSLRQVRETGNDPTGIAVAGSLLTQLEQASAKNNPSIRRGKGIRVKENGEVYSVYSDPDSREAYVSATSMKFQDSGGAKAEHIVEMGPTILSVISQEHPEYYKSASDPTGEITAKLKAQESRQLVIQGSRNIYGDADSRVEWQKLLAKLPPPTAEEIAAADRAREEDERHRAAGGGGGGDDPFAGPSLGGGTTLGS